MTVRHSRGSYEVRLTTVQEAAAGVTGDSFVITDENVQQAWGSAFARLPTLAVPAGESSKSFAMLEHCHRWLHQQGAKRSSTVVALGGGVVGDLGGFVAATYMRGIQLIQVPTTLLAQVDSSVGGKVGIDLPEGKNLVGAFYPPRRVELCLEALSTLPLREFNAGAAEVWKYGAALDEALFEHLVSNSVRLDAPLEHTVLRCVELKAAVVEEDEFETTGRRAVLNFGHTVGHAVEALTGYGPILHGEAVAMGMVVESRLGELMGVTRSGTSSKLRECLSGQGLATDLPGLDPSAMVAAMRGDKKVNRAGGLAFALLTRIGECRLVQDVPEDLVLEALRGV